MYFRTTRTAGEQKPEHNSNLYSETRVLPVYGIRNVVKIMKSAAYALVLVLAFFGNSLIITVIRKTQKLQTIVNFRF